MQEDRTPKVFISYSWSSETQVLQLAERLMNHGVDVVLDKWDLKEGQDKYAFMEQCVNDPDITKVLIFCDKMYTEKANARIGGVGDETVIISKEVYGRIKQEKFIPIISEFDENGDPYVPTYIHTRIYINLSNDDIYEDEYEKLLRNIYEKPLHRKPPLGKRPDWLDEEKTNLFPLTDLLRQIKGATTLKKQQSCVNKFIDEYISVLKSFFVRNITDGKLIYEKYVEMKTVRDVFLDFIVALSETELSFSDTMCSFFEKMYNSLTHKKGFETQESRAINNLEDFEIYKILIWELFICTIAYLRHIENYTEINGMVSNTYFLNQYWHGESTVEQNYCVFRHHSRIIEDQYKLTTEYKNQFTLLGHTLCTEREKLPIFTKEAIAEADLFLYQIKKAFDLVEDNNRWRDSYWFPNCYVYCNQYPAEWKKMKSRKFCKKMYPLFGVDTLEELKMVIAKCTYDENMRYSGSFQSAPAILSCINLDEIGSVN